MSKYLLPGHVHVCIADEGSVFLDVKADRYVGLDADHTRALASLVQGWPDQGGPSAADCAIGIAEQLHQSGLLTTDDRSGHSAEPLQLCRAVCDLWQWSRAARTPLDWTVVARFIGAYLRTLILLRTRSFERILRRVAVRKAKRSRGNPLDFQRLTQATAAFLTLRPLVYSATDKCLMDSLALVEFLSAFDLFPTWVIGVRVAPFAAHSWVQAGDCVLNGPIEYVSPFTPILAI